MKQSLKLGLMVLLVALLAASGIALAQDSTEDSVDPGSTVEEETREFRGRDGKGAIAHIGIADGAMERLKGGIEDVAGVLGIDEAELMEALRDGSTLAEIAEANGVDAATLVEAMTAAATEAIDEAVADGLITQDRADAMLENLPGRITDQLDRSFSGRHGRHHHHHPVARGFIGDEVSEILGLDKAEIHELLEDGQSIAEIAEAQGVDPESLISDVTDAFRERFSEKVYG